LCESWRTVFILAIMGFHTPHVWKTTNAGVSWSDYTANLPDAPVNTIVVDSGTSLTNGMVYVGTDVGIFSSSTGSANWTEVGPTSGQQGFLPNVAVSSLKIFGAGGLKRLRAGTYGRGMWEWNLITNPDFQLSVSNNPVTVFPGQTASYSGTIYALNGYNAAVNLSCASGTANQPQNCSITPNLLLPTPAGTTFVVGAGSSAADYNFNVHAVGLDPLSTTHDFALSLHVIDFNLSAPSPAAVSAVPGNTSTPALFVISALGAFNATVTLSCSGLPAGASCQFQPSASVVPSGNSPATVGLSISTSANTPVGTSQITVSASTPGELPKSQTLALTVGAAADYSLTISNPTLVGSVNVPSTFNGTLTAANGYSSSVNLSCGAGAPPSCVVSPPNTTPTSGGMPFTVTVSSDISQAYSFSVVGLGSDPFGITHSAPVTFTAMPSQNFDFTIRITPASASVPAGQPGTFSIGVSSTTGSFPNNVAFSCSKLPSLTTCTFNPTQVGSGSGDSTVMLTIATTAAIPAALKVTLSRFLFLFPLAAVVCQGRVSVPVARAFAAGAALSCLVLIASCGGGLQGWWRRKRQPGNSPGHLHHHNHRNFRLCDPQHSCVTTVTP
jgi:hypothetical protein